jgi:hypothetical protein
MENENDLYLQKLSEINKIETTVNLILLIKFYININEFKIQIKLIYVSIHLI